MNVAAATEQKAHFLEMLAALAALEFFNMDSKDKYFEEAIKECDQRNIKVCDVRKTWKLMKDNNVDTTELLANKLNHPVRELHYYMAIKLLEKIFED